MLEGMFMINTSLLMTHTTMKDYSQFLLRRFVLHHLTRLFDNPGRQPNSSKSFEHRRRDDTAPLSSDHKHVTFSDACSDALYHLIGGTVLLAGSVREL